MPDVSPTSPLTLARDAAAALSLDELRQLDGWLHERMAAAEAEEDPSEILPSHARLVVEERQGPSGTYRLELVKCGKERCQRCKKTPAHGPYWYRYWKQSGRTRSQYIGKELKERSV